MAEEHEDLANEKLSAEIAELKAKKRKLDTEIKGLGKAQNLEAERFGLEKRADKRDRWKIVVTTIIGVGTIGASLWGLFTKVQSYLDQLEVQTTPQMIQLAEKLAPGEEYDANAAILLANYEKAAVPVLLFNLDGTLDRVNPVIEALRLIMDKKNVPSEAVLRPLRTASKRALTRINDDGGRDIDAIRCHLRALGELGGGSPEETTEFLANLYDEFKALAPLEEIEDDLFLVKTAINEECTKLQHEACIE